MARHTSAMSRAIVSLLVEMSRPPMTNTGTITSIPHRSPTWSPSHPMMGSTTRPGITQSAPTAKPIDRARGGMASDRVARMPGASTARAAVMTEWAAMATHTVGRGGEHEQGEADDPRDLGEEAEDVFGALGHEPGGHAGADDEADQRPWLRRGRRQTALADREVEDLVVDE